MADDPEPEDGDDRTPKEMTESMQGAMSLDGDVEKLRNFYGDWAADYDEDVGAHDYGLPRMMAQTLRQAVAFDSRTERHADPSTPILDAGCGTGLVGVVLAELGYQDIDGVDLSPDMARVAEERGVYRTVEAPVDLTAPPPPHLLASADIVTVGGVFTVGHVPPEALSNMATLVRPDGLLIISTRQAYLDETDYLGYSAELIDSGALELLVHFERAPYTMDSTGDYWGYRVPE